VRLSFRFNINLSAVVKGVRQLSRTAGTTANVRNFFAGGGGEIDLMVLFLHEDLANLFRVFSKGFTLPDAIDRFAEISL